MSKRAPIIIVGICVLLLLVSPFAIGMFAEGGLRERITSYNDQPSMSAEVADYERGFFSSTATINLGVDASELQDMGAAGLPDFSLPIVVEISHGPVLLDEGFGLGTAYVKAYVDPNSEIAVLLQNFLGMPYLIELRGRSGFGRGFEFEGEIPPFFGAFFDTSFSFSGLNFTGFSTPNHIEFEALLEDVSVQSTAQSMLLEGLAMSGDWQPRQDRMPISNFDMSLGRIAASNPLMGAQPQFAADQLSVTSTTTESADGSVMDFSTVMSVGGMTVADELDLNSAELGVTLGQIDAEAANDFYLISGELAEMQNQAVMLQVMMPILDKIVAASPSLSFDPVKLSMAEGDLDATMTISIDPSVLPTGSASDLQNIAFAMAAVNANADFTISKGLAQELAMMQVGTQLAGMTTPDGEPIPPDQLQAMVEGQAGLMLVGLTGQGILIDDGDSYSGSLQFANGQATANGRPLPLMGF